MKMKSSVRFFISVLISSLIMAADQGIKSWIQTHFVPGEYGFRSEWISIVYVRNNGAAFGILSGNSDFLMLFNLALLLAVIFFLLLECRKKDFQSVLPEILICGGAAGNLLDRVRLGYVIDYLYVNFLKFPVFNLADICITAGCVWMFLDTVLKQKKV